MILGIEIGGTKLQLGVGTGKETQLAALQRLDVEASGGAAGILQQIERTAQQLMQQFPVERIGIGFGGPVRSAQGRVIRSHQIAGWEDLPLVGWCEQRLGRPTVLGNDCDVASLAEARLGAGRGKRIVFFLTVGTGVGGGLVIDGRLHGAGRVAVAEIGQLRPGLHDDRPDATVESLASGWGIVATTQARLSGQICHPVQPIRRQSAAATPAQLRQRLDDACQFDEEYAAELRARCHGQLEQLTAKMVAEAAKEGNEIAREVIHNANRALGWAIAQVITLVAPEMVVVGGGVSLMGKQAFWAPLRRHVRQYVFPPLLDQYELVPAALGEAVVVHGAIALAAE